MKFFFYLLIVVLLLGCKERAVKGLNYAQETPNDTQIYVGKSLYKHIHSTISHFEVDSNYRDSIIIVRKFDSLTLFWTRLEEDGGRFNNRIVFETLHINSSGDYIPMADSNEALSAFLRIRFFADSLEIIDTVNLKSENKLTSNYFNGKLFH